jgi:hypothetical protein
MLNKKLILLGTLLVAVLAISAFSAPVSAIVIGQWSGKGAVAQWYITTNNGARTHTINAVLMMNNAGDYGKIYVSVVHASGAVSVASKSIDFKWNMNHISIETTLNFVGPAGTPFSGPHVILIDWQTEGSASNGVQTIPTAHGMTTTVNGALKTGTAQMLLDPIPIQGQYNHQDGYPSSWAAIVHGDVTVNSQ